MLHKEQWYSLNSPRSREGAWPTCGSIFSRWQSARLQGKLRGDSRKALLRESDPGEKLFVAVNFLLRYYKASLPKSFLWFMLRLEDIISIEKAKLESRTAELWKDGNLGQEWNVVMGTASGSELGVSEFVQWTHRFHLHQLLEGHYLLWTLIIAKTKRGFVSKGRKTNEMTPRGSF